MPQDQDRQITLEEFEEQRRKHYGIPSGLAASLRQQESGGRQYDQSGRVLTSPKHAKGRYQVLKSTAAKYQLDPDDPFENVEASFRYLSDLHKQVDSKIADPGERWAQTLAGYHAGEGKLRQVNKTGALPATSDGLIRTDEYVANIMKRWQQHDQGESVQTPAQAPKPAFPNAGTGDLVPPPPARPLSRREKQLAAEETARRNATPAIARMVEDFEALKREGSVEAARSVAAKIKRQFGKWMEVGEGDGFPYVKSKIRGWNPVQPPAGPSTPSLEDQQRAFAERPLLDQWMERAEDALTRGGGLISKAARQTVGLLAGAQQGRLGEVMDFPAWRQGEESRNRNLEARRQARPSSFATEVGEGVIEALPALGPVVLGTAATGGGLPAAMVIGGGMSAAGADWRDPKRAVTQTVLGATAPIAGGLAGRAVGGAVASRLASPAAQATARAGGELVGGGAGNVIGTGAEQLAFEGRLNPRELARSGAVGMGLSVPGAVTAARGARTPGALPEPAMRQGPRPFTPRETADRGIRIAIQRYTQAVDQINLSNISPAQKAAQLEQARLAFVAERTAARNSATQSGPEDSPGAQVAAPRVQFYPQQRTPGGAVIAPESPIANRGLLPPGRPEDVPTEQLDALATGRIPVPDAPETQRMPVVTPAMAAAESGPVRQTAEIPRPGIFGAIRQTAENAPTAELQASPPGPRRRPTERLPVPKGTDENIEELRARQEELGRLAYDRRGDFTGDLRDEFTQLNAAIRDYDNARAPQEIGPPLGLSLAGGRPQSMTPPPEERAARRAALQPRTGPMPETLAPGRPVTQEVQIPGSRAAETHISREDARQGHFERFNDEELVAEIRRMEDVRNQAIRGRSRLTPEELEANRFDLKIAVEMQKERGRLQRQMGREAGERIAPRAAQATVRTIQHERFGELTVAPDQAGVRRGFLRVSDAAGKSHIIKNPRTKGGGNGEAAFTRSIPSAALPELRDPNAPPSPAGTQPPRRKIDHTIPDEAMPELRGKGHVMGGIFGGLQPLFGKGRLPSRAEVSETAGGIQTAAQLGNPRFVIRNVLQHVAFGKQERTATRLAATLDWAYSKATGKGRQIAQPQGSDLASYVRNWRKAVQAHKAGQPLPGGQTSVQHAANANKIDSAVRKLMTWINEIPDSANWQTRFEDSLQSIVRAAQRSRTQLNMADAVDQATMEANKAALRDPNFVSKAALLIKDGLNTASSPVFGTDKFGVGDFVLKYAQTPGALFKRGLERSPLGLFQVAKEAATPGPFRRRNTLLALSRVAEGAATGTGLGAALAAAGVLVGPEEQGRAGQAMEREEGVRGYSLNASALLRVLTGDFSTGLREGDTLYTIDWLQPWAMNLSAGAALWNLHKQGKLGAGSGARAAGEAVYNSLAKTLDVMGDQSVLKNLSRHMSRAVGDSFSDKFLGFARSIGLDIPSSFVPSTARQARQILDPFERDTRPEDRTGVGGFVKEAAGRALAQLPGMSEKFPKRPSLLTGEDRKTALGEMSTGARVGAQFSPANISTFAPRPVAREISRLNRAGQKVSVSFPAPRKGELTSRLRARERRFAETFSQMSREMIEDPFYKEADNKTKAAAFEGLKRYLSALEKGDAEEKTAGEIVEAAIEAIERRRDKEER